MSSFVGPNPPVIKNQSAVSDANFNSLKIDVLSSPTTEVFNGNIYFEKLFTNVCCIGIERISEQNLVTNSNYVSFHFSLNSRLIQQIYYKMHNYKSVNA